MKNKEEMVPGLPKTLPIKKIEIESDQVKTFYFDLKLKALPGQFVMAWLPRVDEKPFTISSYGRQTAITVEKKGLFTEKMFKLKEGDLVGLRGPLGKGFELKENACIVAGGLGAAAIAMLAEELKGKGFNFSIILGARTKDLLLFKERLGKTAKDFYITTDDGSEGRKGFVTDMLAELLAEKKIEMVYTCGPEIMMKKVFQLCQESKVECQASLERFMKCGFGVCGQCTVGSYRVCKDGPVFSSEQLAGMDEFGSFARLKSGKKVSLPDYVKWRGK